MLRAILLILLFSPLSARGQSIQSFIDENGVKVFTNVPRGADRLHVGYDAVATPAPETTKPYGHLIESISDRHGMDSDLVRAIIAVESAFDPNAVSVKNCKGLMQLHPDTARRFGVEDVFDPKQNIEGGVQYLKYLTEFFDSDLERILAGYNAGENAVLKHKGVPPYRETRDYIRKVRKRYDFSQWDGEEEASVVRVARRVERVTRADGTVLYTNVSAGSDLK